MENQITICCRNFPSYSYSIVCNSNFYYLINLLPSKNKLVFLFYLTNIYIFSFFFISLSSMSMNGHYQKSIQFGRCIKHKLIRRLDLNRNSSALSEQPVFRTHLMLPTFNCIPPAPPLPSDFNQQQQPLETLNSTDFSKAIKTHTDRSQTNNSTVRNRRRTPLTPDVLALTKLRRPEHIKSSIAQRIEELKQASLIHSQIADEKPSKIDSSSKILATCEYKNTDNDRQWLHEQTQSKSPVRFMNTTNHLQLNNRLFQLRSIEYLDEKNVHFYLQEDFFIKHFKQMSIITILILSILRLIENTLANLAIPGMHIIVNLIYVVILILIAFILLTNQK